MKKLNKNIKTIILLLIVVVLGYILIIEYKSITIDKYNFEQLEKVKYTLDNLDKNSYKFYNIKEFNEKFNQDIKPLKNCYFLSERNGYFEDNKGGGGYIFGFKLESLLYKIIYFKWYYYAYPKYDLPVDTNPTMNADINFTGFMKTISNPCKY